MITSKDINDIGTELDLIAKSFSISLVDSTKREKEELLKIVLKTTPPNKFEMYFNLFSKFILDIGALLLVDNKIRSIKWYNIGLLLSLAKIVINLISDLKNGELSDSN